VLTFLLTAQAAGGSEFRPFETGPFFRARLQVSNPERNLVHLRSSNLLGLQCNSFGKNLCAANCLRAIDNGAQNRPYDFLTTHGGGLYRIRVIRRGYANASKVNDLQGKPGCCANDDVVIGGNPCNNDSLIARIREVPVVDGTDHQGQMQLQARLNGTAVSDFEIANRIGYQQQCFAARPNGILFSCVSTSSVSRLRRTNTAHLLQYPWQGFFRTTVNYNFCLFVKRRRFEVDDGKLGSSGPSLFGPASCRVNDCARAYQEEDLRDLRSVFGICAEEGIESLAKHHNVWPHV